MHVAGLFSSTGILRALSDDKPRRNSTVRLLWRLLHRPGSRRRCWGIYCTMKLGCVCRAFREGVNPASQLRCSVALLPRLCRCFHHSSRVIGSIVDFTPRSDEPLSPLPPPLPPPPPCPSASSKRRSSLRAARRRNSSLAASLRRTTLAVGAAGLRGRTATAMASPAAPRAAAARAATTRLGRLSTRWAAGPA